MEIACLSVGPIGTNCYILHENKEALIIDPGGDAEEIMDFIQNHALIPQAILLTHAHFDHIGAVDELRSAFDIEVYIHEQESAWLTDSYLNGSKGLMGMEVTAKPADHFLKSEHMKIASFSFKVFHTPGHSPGSVSFLFREASFIVSGDVLFQQGIGRTDLAGGNIETLESSIRNVLYSFHDDLIVYPGHGPDTTIGEEKGNNPFFRE